MRRTVTTHLPTMAAIAAIALGVAVSPGCYLSHSAPPDAFVPPLPDAPVPDAPHPIRCQSGCAPPRTIASLDATSMGVDHRPSSLRAAVIVDGVLYLAYLFPVGDETSYRVARIDLSSGELLGHVGAPDGVTTQRMTVGMLAVGAEVSLTTLAHEYRPRGGPVPPWPFAPRVTRVDFGVGGASAGVSDVVGELPLTLERCECALRGTVFGRGVAEAAAVLEHDALWLTPLDVATSVPASEPVLLATFPGAPPRVGATEGAMLMDGTVLVVGGGLAVDLDARDAFLAVAAPGSPARVETVPGGRFDPPPRVIAAASRFGVFRYVSDRRDAASGRVSAELREPAGVVDRISVVPDDGVQPAAMAPYATATNAGLVWVEVDGTLRALPPPVTSGAWDACGEVEGMPLQRFDGPLAVTWAETIDGSALLAIDAGDGSGDTIVVAHVADSSSRFEVVRLSDCELTDPR